MNLRKKLKKVGITEVEEISSEDIRMIANNVTEIITKTFPYLYSEYNNILVKLLNCKMYKANMVQGISKVNYMYEDGGIYFDKNIDLNKTDVKMIHECIHYLQDFRGKKGELKKIGLCNFVDFSVKGMGINEAAVRYMSAKTAEEEKETIVKYGIRLKTNSKNYYPILTNIIEQIIYLFGEEKVIKATLDLDEGFEDDFLNTYEGNTKKIINEMDCILERYNSIIFEKKEENIKYYEKEIVNSYLKVEEMLFKGYFDNAIPRIETVQEIDYYTEKINNYKEYVGIKEDDLYNGSNFYDKEKEELVNKLDNRLYQITKERSKNMLMVIKGSKVMQMIKRMFAYFTN